MVLDSSLKRNNLQLKTTKFLNFRNLELRKGGKMKTYKSFGLMVICAGLVLFYLNFLFSTKTSQWTL